MQTTRERNPLVTSALIGMHEFEIIPFSPTIRSSSPLRFFEKFFFKSLGKRSSNRSTHARWWSIVDRWYLGQRTLDTRDNQILVSQRYQQTASDVSVPEVSPNNGPPAPVEHLLTTVDIWRRGCVTKQQPSLANTRETQLRHSTWPIQLCQSSGTGGGRGRNNAPPNQWREILAGQIYLSGRIYVAFIRLARVLAW